MRVARAAMGATAALVVAAIVGGVFRSSTATRQIAVTRRPVPAYEIASDADVLRSLQNESVLVVRGPQGVKQVVWLDGNGDASSK
jgi:uncharacterized membrane protein (DUF4010 family)